MYLTSSMNNKASETILKQVDNTRKQYKYVSSLYYNLY